MQVNKKRYDCFLNKVKELNDRQPKLFYKRGWWCVDCHKRTRKKFKFKWMAKLYFLYVNKIGK